MNCLEIVIKLIGLGAILFAVYKYSKDKKWNRAESSFQFYNDFDSKLECKLAMFMLDNHEIDFSYKSPLSDEVIKIKYDLSKRHNALSKKEEGLNNEEANIRFIFDVYIGYLERIFYLHKSGIFKSKDLFFYKYWLDKLISDDCKDIKEYAKGNSCGLFIPFLRKYESGIQRSIKSFID
ncbi:MAG: hypothetical protein MI739_04300 [Bacteroidales bacterium]|nr:hypothetical protein [Bacteroidales bacterium]